MPAKKLDRARTLKLAAEIASAYIGNNPVLAHELPPLVEALLAGLHLAACPSPVEPPEPIKPAVAIRKSITPDYIVCLEDGQRFKSLKRHLRTRYAMSPDEYRAKWGLNADYPMVAPAYARERSRLAKQMGLGQQRRRMTP